MSVVLVGGSREDQLTLLPHLSFADSVTLIVPESPNDNQLRQAQDLCADQSFDCVTGHDDGPANLQFVSADLARIEGRARVGDTLRQMEAPDLVVLLSAPLANDSLLHSEASDLSTELARSVDGWAYVCRAAIPEMQRHIGKPFYILGVAASNPSTIGAHGRAIGAWQQTFLAALKDEVQSVGNSITFGFCELQAGKLCAKPIGGSSFDSVTADRNGGNADLVNWFASVTAG